MCFNMVIYNPKISRLPIDVIMNIVSDESRFNDDGFSFYAVVGGEEVVLRTLDKNKFINDLRAVLERNPFLLHLHLRAASSGSISEENVHMWRVANDSNYYYVSHNGHVGRFATGRFIFYNSYGSYSSTIVDTNPVTSHHSDTRQMVDQQEFRDALLKKDLKRLSSILTDYGFYGVLFATNPREIVAVSKYKSIKVLVFNGILFMSNNDISRFFGGRVNLFGFVLLAKPPHGEFENKIIVYDLTNTAVAAVEETKNLYSSVSSISSIITGSQKTGGFFPDKEDEEEDKEVIEEDEEEEDEAVEEGENEEEIDIDDEFYTYDQRRFKWLWRSRDIEI